VLQSSGKVIITHHVLEALDLLKIVVTSQQNKQLQIICSSW